MKGGERGGDGASRNLSLPHLDLSLRLGNGIDSDKAVQMQPSTVDPLVPVRPRLRQYPSG